ncbi:hypothetical protein J8TS2_16710 [Lederbergia ruris]|uniref:DUF3231 family protein n=1 Tax=Lederbergia ruris TaxID=217495 RepID=A0ABQ4KHG7_9BACI|nr:DUF3231 family protein [Lederbergia ruris]GIN57352.1 hypothetical protein J8TS2_16710 [Lederbergia ruris]
METNDTYQDELTAAEVSALWTSYQNDTMMICGLRHFLTHVTDGQIRSILEQFLAISEEHQTKITDIFNAENYPIPQGFTEQDVNLEAPRLFSDRIYLDLMLNVANFSMAIYGLASSQVERDDIIQFYLEAVDETQRMYKITKDTVKAKGLYIRYPQIPKPKHIDFVTDDSFLTGFFGEKRPLLGVEITALVLNTRRNALGQALVAGFAQVAQSKEVRKYFEKGRDIATKHLEIFSSILNKEFINDGSRILTSEVTNSTNAPFSDKLMMFLVTTLIASGMGQYGSSMSISPRHDLGVQYARLMAEIGKYANQGANILINNAWMEQPPIAADRKNLAK